ncbi:YciI family protein [Paraburkholderia sp. J67]|uniref:YciI family protein n=1 Tax=Paraburkholderia sp. J67 TaxID=2805435 RepID=UPI002ABDDD92|nr:YciI family protein [Paraburkholderia sp. J67]
MARYFAVFATDRPDMREARERVRAQHRSHLRTAARHGVFVRLGGATLAPQDDLFNGTLLVIEAEGIDEVMAFVSDDPYMQAGVFERVEVRPWDWSVGNPERRV